MVVLECMFIFGCIEWCEYIYNIMFVNKFVCIYICRNIKNYLNVCWIYINKFVFIEINYVLICVLL